MATGKETAAPQAVVPSTMAGERLDRAAMLVWPDIGLRGRRRLLAAGALTVDGRVRDAAYRVRTGENLAVVALPAEPTVFTAADVPVLFCAGEYAAVAKPAGLHSAAIAHGGGASLEALLPAIFPEAPARLLSRLDRLTSGIVPVAFGEAAALAYRRAEEAGAVAKTYLCVTHGGIPGPFTIDRALDMADRARTRVLRCADADPLRHTHVTPLRCEGGVTLVSCRIAKGARHQIRAHLAGAGYPLVGDPLYGQGEGERLFLHCAGLAAPAFRVENEPPWTMADAMAAVAKAVSTRKGR